MNPRVKICRQIDYCYDAYWILRTMAGEGDYFDDLRTGFQDRYKQTIEPDMAASIELGKQIMQSVYNELEERRPEIEKLFSGDDEWNCPVYLTLNLDALKIWKNVAELLEDYHKSTELERDRRFLAVLAAEVMDRDTFERLLSENDAARVKNIFSTIQKLDVTEEQRGRIADCYLNRDAYAEKAVELLETAVSALKKFEPQMLEEAVQWESYWQRSLENESFLDIINSLVRDVNAEEVWLIPMFAHVGTVSAHTPGEFLGPNQPSVALFRMGMIIREKILAKGGIQGMYVPEECQRILKLLGDKSKFDILLFLRDKSAYGVEIAEQFGLTTATVSHHMKQLFENRLVKVELRDKRTYYRTNKETLQEVMSSCNNLFQS